MKAIEILSLVAIAAAASAAAQQTPPENQERERRVRILLNGAYNPGDIGFTDTFTFPSFLEDGRSSRTYDGGKGAVFEVGAIVEIKKPLGVMGSVEIYQSDFTGRFEDQYPHPLYFNEPRTASGEVTGLDYKEKAVHLDAVYTRAFSSVTVDLFGGPSFFFTNTDVLNTVTTASDYPFDEVTVTSTSNTTLDDNPIGFNAGGAVTWRLTDVLGIAFQARFSRASIGIAREGGEAIELDAGGFRVGGGIRLAF